jgi:hypothetical protein
MSWHSQRHRAARSPGQTGEPAGQPNVCNGDSRLDAPSSEMPRFSRQDQLTSAPDEFILDMLLDRVSPAPEAPPQMGALLTMLADLSGPAEPGELAAEAAVLSRFRSRVHPAGILGSTSRPSRRTSLWRRLIPHSPRAAAGLAATAIVLGGTAAAYAGALPTALQNFAHSTINAPAVRHASPPGHGPGHQPGITQPGSASPRHAPQSAAPGTDSNHTQPSHNGDIGRAAHPAQPRPSAEPSPQSGQAGHTGPPAHPSLAPQASSHPQQSHTPQPGQQAQAGQPSQQGRLTRTRSPGQAGPASPPETTCPSPGSYTPPGQLLSGPEPVIGPEQHRQPAGHTQDMSGPGLQTRDLAPSHGGCAAQSSHGL